MIIGEEVNVTILGVKGNHVRLGINAPKEVSVHRQEIWLKIKNETEVYEKEIPKRTITSLYTGRKSNTEGILKTG